MTVVLIPQLWPPHAAALPSDTQVRIDPSLRYHNPERVCHHVNAAAKNVELLRAMVYGFPCACWREGPR